MRALTVTENRAYLETHPWLTFEIHLAQVPTTFWIALGECQSKFDHIAGIPLAPEIDEYLHQVYLAKGVAATAAIEGNTLSEQQVLEHLQGTLKVPPSQEYLQQEITNIVSACNSILKEIEENKKPSLTVKRIKELNGIVLNNLTLEPEVVPGQIRHHVVGVGNYRGAPAEDCEFLLERLCEWLESEVFKPAPGLELIYAVLKAIVAHLYLAWIHPFGDGNGRTARLLELQILLSSSVPSPASHLLSNYYNRTRNEYYRQLTVARKNISSFLEYAVSGLRDELREEIQTLRIEQWEIAWVNYVHKRFDGLKGAADNRRKHLVLDLSKLTEPVPLAKLRDVSPRVAAEYSRKSPRTLWRDARQLNEMGLIVSVSDGKWKANKRAILSFLPTRARDVAQSR